MAQAPVRMWNNKGAPTPSRLYLDYRTGMIGRLAADTDEVAAAVRKGEIDPASWDAFITHSGESTRGAIASAQVVERFLPDS